MKLFKDNKPIIFSTLTGLFYLLYAHDSDKSEEIKQFFMALLMFLPGITFPLATSYFKTKSLKNRNTKILLHFVISIATYHLTVWIFSLEGKYRAITILDGFLGSFMYLVVSKYILELKITPRELIISNILSGLAFLPCVLLDNKLIYWGLALFSWTMVNGFTINYALKKIDHRIDNRPTPDS